MKVPIWLASGSPRRRQLLEWCGYPVIGHPAAVEEFWVEGEAPDDAAERLARLKCVGPTAECVLAADTVVHLEGRAFGKPIDADDAVRMLGELSGRWHHVTTGVCLARDGKLESFRCTTDVRFRSLSMDGLQRYVATGEPLDKAGGYGIQGIGGALIAEIRGSWTNVMGLPMEATLAAIERT